LFLSEGNKASSATRRFSSKKASSALQGIQILESIKVFFVKEGVQEIIDTSLGVSQEAQHVPNIGNTGRVLVQFCMVLAVAVSGYITIAQGISLHHLELYYVITFADGPK
jgi:hypothetical protein